ncbi:hypothetical protein KI387_037055, partial [Taxus chinensis]
KRFLFWWGIEPRMSVTEPHLIKQILSSKYSLCYGKSYLQQRGVRDFIGKGLVMANGEAWAHQRRVVAPAFTPERIKNQVRYMVDSTLEMSDRWRRIANGSSEVEVSADLSRLTGDIIARTIFGNNFESGRNIFEQLTILQKLSSLAGRYQWLPISRFFLVSLNSKIRKLKVEVENSVEDIIETRVGEKEKSYGDDLLGIMLSHAHLHDGEVDASKNKLTRQQIIDECKTFFFAGHDTTAMLLTWTMMLLAANPSWQDNARHEILTACGTQLPDADSLEKLKVLGMVVNESLRLYTPASLLARQALRDMKVGGITIPEGLSVWIPTLAIHHDKEIWGEDADEFKPERFAKGAGSACKHPMGFLPFSYGGRSCVGQTLAIVETKLVLALILTRFAFRLSPNYRHAPVFVLTLKPKYGLQLILQTIQ